MHPNAYGNNQEFSRCIPAVLAVQCSVDSPARLSSLKVVPKGFLRDTLSMVYKKRCKIETSPFLSIFCWCYCSIYDVIASLLLNKASKIRLVVSYKGVSFKPY